MLKYKHLKFMMCYMKQEVEKHHSIAEIDCLNFSIKYNNKVYSTTKIKFFVGQE